MALIAGISGARRNATAAVCRGAALLAVCEQERVRRIRNIGAQQGGFPTEALEAVLAVSGYARDDIRKFVVAEPVPLPPHVETETLSHHFGHAATAFYTSGFDEAVVLVCDSRSTPELSAWSGRGRRLVPLAWQWEGPGFARVFSRLTRAFGLLPDWEEHKLEALARLGRASGLDRAARLVGWSDGRLRIDPHLEERVDDWLRSGADQFGDIAHQAEVASSFQQHLATLLLAVVDQLRRSTTAEHLCLGGGLFFNTYFNTVVAESGAFRRTFVPANPGNAGLAPGGALAVGASEGSTPAGPYSPYLGPAYSPSEIKAVLDNCKLVYDCLDETRLIDRTVDVLQRGHLVGWFQGRMEWGPRALGHRSILASPLAPYVVENLSTYLKRREPHRGFSVSVCAEDLPRYFEGPPRSAFMEHEYRVKDPKRFGSLLKFGARRLRVHTVGDEVPLFRQLLKTFGQATGVPVLVNTSFNGFHEPMVCTPRDAVRVFYGSALDVLAMGQFFVQK